MPTYTFFHKETGEEKTEYMSISGMVKYLEDNPEWDTRPTSPRIGYSFGGLKGKIPKEFNDRLRSIRDAHPRSTIDIHE